MGRFIATVPSYYKDFVCKCGACRHTCCDGWGITISEAEYFRLLGAAFPDDLRRRLDSALTVLDDPSPERYAYLRPNYLGDCKMLTESGLCALHAVCGEDELPLICRLYPRSVKRYGGRHEIVISNTVDVTKLVKAGDMAENQEDPAAPVKVPLDARVSMNCWGFTPQLFAELEDRFARFLAARGTEMKSEWYIPFVVDELIKEGKADCKVLPTDSRWFGVTYREDKPYVVSEIAKLVASGEYPSKLF